MFIYLENSALIINSEDVQFVTEVQTLVNTSIKFFEIVILRSPNIVVTDCGVVMEEETAGMVGPGAHVVNVASCECVYEDFATLKEELLALRT